MDGIGASGARDEYAEHEFHKFAPLVVLREIQHEGFVVLEEDDGAWKIAFGDNQIALAHFDHVLPVEPALDAEPWERPFRIDDFSCLRMERQRELAE